MSSREPTRPPAPPPAPHQAATPPGPPPSSTVRDTHRQRNAIVYVRQSTPQQVINNTASADRPYGLAGPAALLGWAPARVQVVDGDQRKSGPSASGRPGFPYLLAEIALGHVGIVLG